jgi:hypothetical protein
MDVIEFGVDDLPADVIEYEILKKAGTEPSGWKWTINGPSHPKALARAEQQSRKSLIEQKQIKQAQVNGKKFVAEDRSVDDAKRDNVEWIVSRTLGWNKPIVFKHIQPEPISYSDEAVTKLLMRPDMGWLFTQIVDVLAEEKSFMKKSAEA